MEKVAIIQLDTNLLKLELVNVLPSGNFLIYDEMVEPISFTDDLNKDGFIRPTRITEAMNILKMFKTLCDVNEVTKSIAVATSVFKEFKNHRSFFEEVYNNNNFRFKIMPSEEELQTLYVGIVNTMDIPKALIMDISSSTTSLIYYNRRNILNTATLPIGASAMAQLFAESKDSPEEICKKMVELFKNELKAFSWLKDLDPEFKFIGSGDAFQNIGRLSRKLRRYPIDLGHNYVMTKENMQQVYDLIKTLDFDKAKKIKGIPSESSAILISGVCIAKAMLDSLTVDEFAITSKGVAEGLVFAHAMPITNEKPISDLLGYSLETIDAFYGKPEANAKQVGELALILFRQLKVLHKLSRSCLKVLRIAAIMHDCGKRIKLDGHSKNGFNIILNSDIQGASHREIILAAFVCASQDSNDFNLTEWVKYKDLFLEEDLLAVKKLAIIVRIAEALDRTHRNAVVDISCDVLGDSVIMKTIVTTDASVEIREALKAGLDFKKAYGKNLEVL